MKKLNLLLDKIKTETESYYETKITQVTVRLPNSDRFLVFKSD